MKRLQLLSLILVLAMLAGCGGVAQPETTAPAVSFTTPSTAEPTTQSTTEPTTQPTTVPETEPAPLPQTGFYLLDSLSMDGLTLSGEMILELKCYIEFREDGTGKVSLMHEGQEFFYDEHCLTAMNDPISYLLEADTLTLEDEGQVMVFRYHGTQLPEEYLPIFPVGFFAVSSVGVNGDVSFYGTVDPANGYIRIHEDLTGVMVYDGVIREFTVSEGFLYVDGIPLQYVYTPADEAMDEEEMLMVVLQTENSVTTIVFRPVEDPEAENS